MAFDVVTGRTKVGLVATDASQDAEITACLNAALAFAEQYCDRDFVYMREKVVKMVDRQNEGVFVNRYPIGQVHSINGAAVNSAAYGVHASAGVLFLHNRSAYGMYGWRPDSMIEIDYEGGFKELPADLEFALWSMFGAAWPSFDPSIATTGGGTTVAIGAVKKRTIVGVGSVEYETGGGSQSSGSTGALAADWSAIMPGATQAILDLYSRKVA